MSLNEYFVKDKDTFQLIINFFAIIKEKNKSCVENSSKHIHNLHKRNKIKEERNVHRITD